MKNNYLRTTRIYEESEERLSDLVNIRDEIQASERNYPEGNIRIKGNRHCPQYYIKRQGDSKTAYLSKKDDAKIKALLQKWYNTKVLRLVNQEIKGLQYLLSRGKKIEAKIRDLYSANPEEIKRHLIPYDISNDDYVEAWMAEEYPKMPMDEEAPVYITDRGERVRSKSELTIANALARERIPYRYECPLRLRSGIVVHPDFTVLCVSSRKVVYWEHRGMMDDVGYARKAIKKTKDYMNSGILLGKRLFVTEETQTAPLSTSEIKSIIELLR